MRGRLGAFEKNTLQTNMNSLNVAVENVTSSESTIRDALLPDGKADIVTALHACDTATDEAILFALRHEAKFIALIRSISTFDFQCCEGRCRPPPTEGAKPEPTATRFFEHDLSYYVIGSLVWAAVIALVFTPLAMRAYRKG